MAEDLFRIKKWCLLRSVLASHCDTELKITSLASIASWASEDSLAHLASILFDPLLFLLHDSSFYLSTHLLALTLSLSLCENKSGSAPDFFPFCLTLLLAYAETKWLFPDLPLLMSARCNMFMHDQNECFLTYASEFTSVCFFLSGTLVSRNPTQSGYFQCIASKCIYTGNHCWSNL